MALAFTITNSSGPTSFRLQVTRVVISHTRAPVAAPLPGNDPLLIDLGQWKCNITLEGTAPEIGTNLTEGGVSIAEHNDLESMADPNASPNWYSNNITLTDDSDRNAGTNPVYTVKIAGLTLSKQEAHNFWSFTMNFVGFLSTPGLD